MVLFFVMNSAEWLRGAFGISCQWRVFRGQWRTKCKWIKKRGRINRARLLFLFLLQHAPGVPKILVGNRLHLAFKRQVSELSAETYALKNEMAFFEVSPLCDFNITESLAELSRLVLKRNGMSRTWGPNRGMSASHILVAPRWRLTLHNA